ncbi:hypothetical protein ENUP19_0054G0015 [Entamoeba nuttalli]|uniref:PRA1 family protein n=1 Tax=Entamoeba nuttalli TaxID=412467 RepID=A0ABQ0DC57_9EUKA
MNKINELTTLLEEVLSKNYHIPSGNQIWVRAINNIKRYEIVYFLIILVVQLLFLLIDKELLLPTFIILVIPIFALFVNPYLKIFHCQTSLYPTLMLLAIMVSFYYKCIGMFSVDVSLSLILIFIHMTSFDSSQFNL